MPTTTQAAIKKWLTAGDKGAIAALKKCELDCSKLETSHILAIDCPDRKTLTDVRNVAEIIAEKAVVYDIVLIYLRLDGRIRNCFPPRVASKWKNKVNAEPVPVLDSIPNDAPEAICIIRMADNLGLFCTDALAEVDKCSPNDWIHRNIVDDLNIPDVFEGYIKDLLDAGYLDNYELLTTDSEGRRQRQIIRAWLVQYREDLCRVVQVLSYEYI